MNNALSISLKLTRSKHQIVSHANFASANQYIKNGDAPSCKDCAYFQKQSSLDYNMSKCLKYGTKDVISGNIRYEFAINARDYHNVKCGIKGNDYVSIFKDN